MSFSLPQISMAGFSICEQCSSGTTAGHPCCASLGTGVYCFISVFISADLISLYGRA